ncbi:MAG: MmgE/PrpD family protein [Proteobacteria bacterium]|nr:MmgE/PrpD family protein [Pseudomonadota bacterium]
MSLTQEIARFAAEIQYENLPSFVVSETKKLLLDSIGCAIGGIKTQKGEIAIRLARVLGGQAENGLWGTGDKVGAAQSAYAIGELMNALDYESLLSPPAHATPYVLAAPLAIAEMKKVSGKELIVATAIAHELATRIASAMVFGRRFSVELAERGIAMSLPTPGYGVCAFGGAAAAGRLLGLDALRIAHAMGIAGYNAPVPMVGKFVTTVPVSDAKYMSSGFLSLAQTIAVISAEMGSTGDVEVLDGDHGFWRAFGCDKWMPEYITSGLGNKWVFTDRLFYKRYPCCGVMQNALCNLEEIITTNNLLPEDIMEITVKLNSLAEFPLWKTRDVKTNAQAQFSVPFVFAVAAHRIETGPLWQIKETIEDRRIHEFMKKINLIIDLDDKSGIRPEVEVTAFKEANKKTYFKSGISKKYEMTDDDITDKFRRNTRMLLDDMQAEKVIKDFKNLENMGDVSNIFKYFNRTD